MVTSRRRRLAPSSDRHRRQSPPASMQFFKVVLPSAAEKKMLRIPPNFVNKFGSELSDVATLTTPSGFQRRIQLKRDGKEIWFQNGWCEFAEHHSIREGHFLVFNYTGNSSFQVLIFDLTASEIDYPCDYINIRECDDDDDEMEAEGEGFPASQGTKNGKTRFSDGSAEFEWIPTGLNSRSDAYKVTNTSVESIDGSMEGVIELDEPYESDAPLHTKMERGANFGGTAIERFKKLTWGKKILCNQHNQLKSMKTRNDTVEPLEVPQECAEIFRSQKLSCIAVRKAKTLKLKNPSFVVVIPHRFCEVFLHIPAKFTRRYLARALDHICIQDPKGRNWRVCFYKDRHYLRLGSGWGEVSQANDLKEGDICAFELIQEKETTGRLKLHRVC